MRSSLQYHLRRAAVSSNCKEAWLMTVFALRAAGGHMMTRLDAAVLEEPSMPKHRESCNYMT